jgi:hypothetical protein
MMFLLALYMSWKGGAWGYPIGSLFGGLFSPAFFGNFIQTVVTHRRMGIAACACLASKQHRTTFFFEIFLCYSIQK